MHVLRAKHPLAALKRRIQYTGVIFRHGNAVRIDIGSAMEIPYTLIKGEYCVIPSAACTSWSEISQRNPDKFVVYYYIGTNISFQNIICAETKMEKFLFLNKFVSVLTHEKNLHEKMCSKIP